MKTLYALLAVALAPTAASAADARRQVDRGDRK
jgi:hypothetical protein